MQPTPFVEDSDTRGSLCESGAAKVNAPWWDLKES